MVAGLFERRACIRFRASPSLLNLQEHNFEFQMKKYQISWAFGFVRLLFDSRLFPLSRGSLLARGEGWGQLTEPVEANRDRAVCYGHSATTHLKIDTGSWGGAGRRTRISDGGQLGRPADVVSLPLCPANRTKSLPSCSDWLQVERVWLILVELVPVVS